ncbi:DUF4345 domain-containing protein [Nocardia lijiangensis]|uniref:DUF4345 domain-containing protein n=1 Tax=Nocardia lijiangensis TaxID=299618 RepID=UPI003D72A9F4
MVKALKFLSYLMGVSIVLIGIYHLTLGQWSVPGAGPTTATIDSRERFYSAIFLGYGLAWIWAARQSPIPALAIRVLAGIFLLGGIGRVLSLPVAGWPHWMQIAEAVVELLLPLVFFWLAAADEKAVSGEDARVTTSAARLPA